MIASMEENMPGLRQRLEAIGLSWDWLLDRCEQVILFGSRAANVHGPDADYDLLCVMRPNRALDLLQSRITVGIDLLWISPERLQQAEWLGSELAQHIARYGRWLHGENTWGHAVFPSEQAVLKKSEQIKERIEALVPRWERLLPSYRRKYSRLVRRDLQRLHLLTIGEAVPPTPLLDREWLQVQESLAQWARMHIRPGLLVPSLIDQLPWLERIPRPTESIGSNMPTSSPA